MFEIRKRLRIEGLNINRLLTKIQNLGVAVSFIDRVAYDCVELELQQKDIKKVLGIKDLACYNVTELGYRGQGTKIMQKLSRIGVILGLVAVIIASAISFGKVWNINISVEGENQGIETQVVSLLAEHKITTGKRFASFSLKEVEDLVMKTIDDASLVVASREGVNLNLFLKMGVKQKPMQEGNLVAKFSGVVRSVDLKSGILKINVGDYVASGQTLIESGAVGDIFLEAQGSVVATTWITGEAYGLTRHTTLVRTGQVVQNSWIELCGKKFGADKENVPPFEFFETETEEVLLTDGLVLPLKKCTQKYYEQVLQEVEISEQDLIEELKEKAYNIARNNLSQGMEEQNVSYTILNEGTFFKVVCEIETMCDITLRENAEK